MKFLRSQSQSDAAAAVGQIPNILHRYIAADIKQVLEYIRKLSGSLEGKHSANTETSQQLSDSQTVWIGHRETSNHLIWKLLSNNFRLHHRLLQIQSASYVITTVRCVCVCVCLGSIKEQDVLEWCNIVTQGKLKSAGGYEENCKTEEHNKQRLTQQTE